MARMYPSVRQIKSKYTNISEEELKLMYLLENSLEDTFYVYLEPFLNGDIPKVIIMNNKGNIFIIETSNIDINECEYYKYNGSYGEFKNKNKELVVNPFKQVRKYKDDIFGLHIEQLFMEKERDSRIFGIIKTGVYFTKATKEEIREKFDNVNTNVEHIKIWGRDSNVVSDIKNFCSRRNDYMNQILFDELHRLFVPSFHSFEIGKNTTFTEKQKKLITSEANSQKKIRGIAGSGKTLVLAHKAVYSNKRVFNERRTFGKILILTYNITLINYIKERIQSVREDFHWSSFAIKHYHGFIFEQAKKHNIPVNLSIVNNDKRLNDKFKSKSKDLSKYDAILIDEGQDFKKHWFEILKDNFLEQNGEFIIFADEKQNIYDREVGEDKKTTTNIIGRWSELNSNSFRLGSDIVDLANKFQFEFFNDKYELNEIENTQQYMFNIQDLLYKNDKDIEYNQIFDELVDYIKKNEINNNNISIISNKIEDIRSLECYARNKYDLNIERTFETKEEYDELSRIHTNKKVLEDKIIEIRRNRKFNFKFNRSKIKMSTIHSFKGWETDTLILIIDNDEDEDNENNKLTPELIYTAITRCTTNLIIYNRGNKKYHNFFANNMDDLCKYMECAILNKQSF